MNELNWLIDGLIVLLTAWLAMRALGAADLLEAVVKFVAFGLMVTLVWVRLHAPDVALAEAAIGSGLTGALLLSAIAKIRRHPSTEGPSK